MKLNNKVYSHSGYSLKQKTWKEMLEKCPQKLAFKIIKGMIPRTKLGKKQLKRLYIYPEDSYPHQAQKKQFIEIEI